MNIYLQKITLLKDQEKRAKLQYNYLSTFRLAIIVASILAIYQYLDTQNSVYLYGLFSLLAVFFILVKRHQKIALKRNYLTALLQINKQEADYLNSRILSYDSGNQFINTQHPFTHDLDIFGEKSLYHHVNRTHTVLGAKALAHQLETILPNDQILQNQEAIQELTQKIDWRQRFAAYAKLTQDNLKSLTALQNWKDHKNEPLPTYLKIIAVASPLLFVALVITYFVTSELLYLQYLSYLFVFNQLIFGSQFKKISQSIQHSDQIDEMMKQYSKILEVIEKEDFTSKKLQSLREKLFINHSKSSAEIKKLSEIMANLDTIGNLVIAVVFNGIGLYHLHIYNQLLKWKHSNQAYFEQWLEVISQFEMLNSFANLHYNNPDFCFPVLNNDQKIEFDQLAHPLINSEVRVSNSVNFNQPPFMILTGSNMSGKSTFLRSVGINMLLAGMGSSVCASRASVHPMPIFVSMRLSDSLSDSQSYFFAEIKRLKQIMDALKEQPTFVLLDEILRGTNSDDKQNGTIGVIEKMVAQNVVGVIATHDIEVCELKQKHPTQISNYCFEAQIISDTLHFDYTLREGICKNKSATFLMKKMEII